MRRERGVQRAVHVALCLKDVYRSKHIILLSIILIQRIKANDEWFRYKNQASLMSNLYYFTLKLNNSEAPTFSKKKRDLTLTSHWVSELQEQYLSLQFFSPQLCEMRTALQPTISIANQILLLHRICISTVFGSVYATVWQITCSSVTLKHKVSAATGRTVMETAVLSVAITSYKLPLMTWLGI